MGLGLYTKASLLVGGTGPVARPRTLTADDLQKACSAFLAGTPLEGFKAFNDLWDGRPGFSLSFHPAEEGMDFHIEGTDVFVAAKTSSAGPGYHAFAVTLLEHLQATLQLAWQFGGENDEFQDEAGYWHDRDAARLQGRFATFMAQLFRMCLEKRTSGSSGFRLGMPLEFVVKLPDPSDMIGALTQVGPFSWDDLTRGSGDKPKHRTELAARYFPWWEQGFGADFYVKLALQDMWMHQAWTAPVDEEDRRAMQRVLGWVDTARKLDPTHVRPDLAIAELRKLVRSTDAPVLAEQGPIGYRRHPMSRPLTGHWHATVPGCLTEVPGEDTGTMIYAVSNFEVHGSSFRLSALGNEPMPVEDDAGEALFTQQDLRGSIVHKSSDDHPGFTMTAVANTPVIGKSRERGIVTVWFADETLKPTAEQVLRSLRYDPPNPA